MSRITITTRARPHELEQCMKQIRRLVNVIKLRDMSGEEAVKRELALVCVRSHPDTQKELLDIMNQYNGKIIDKGHEHYTFEVTARENQVDELLALLAPFGIKKLARSGLLALYREP